MSFENQESPGNSDSNRARTEIDTVDDAYNPFLQEAGEQAVEAEFGRLHPMSLVFEVTSHVRTLMVPAAIAVFSAANRSRPGMIFAALIFVPTLLRSVIRYFSLKYRIHNGELVVTEGIFFRRIRTVPVDRIQNIDLIQNVVHRIFKVAEVRVETASGTEAEATLRVLSIADVEKLRADISSSRDSSQPTESAEAASSTSVDDHPSEPLLTIPTSWLLRAGLTSNRGTLLLGVLIGACFQFDLEKYIDIGAFARLFSEKRNPVTVVVFSILAVVGVLLFFRLLGVVWYLLRFHGYQLTRTGDDLRINCGLLTKVSATVPRQRIQFISIHRNLLMRWMNLASIRIETAGGAGGGNEDAAKTVSSRWFIPVLPAARVSELMNKLRPEMDWNVDNFDWQSISPRAPMRLSRLSVLGSILIGAVGFAITRPWGWVYGVAALPILIFIALKKSRSKRYARNDDCVVFRSGIFTTKTSVTFFEKIQTVRVNESPFDRRWKMASLCIDTAAAGPADHRIHIDYLQDDFAKREYEEILKKASGHLPVFG